ncbi:uncharacterized protein K02A2.6-like [Paramacrobiotus metropolitanus]|uniref:uncharacterized protein K02A2.6-like n=1 Tax=Paramacrobiotus metropolitanus TaxID=2943436 RepID=UPI00244596E0|nr:uncharacterized protein K02A2.6-like [Paramacrobiotus metropolitanus]
MHEAIHAVQMDVLSETPVDAKKIASETGKDRVLARCRHLVLKGWPEKAPPELQPYNRRRVQLSVVAGCVLWGARTVIPESFQAVLLKHLHATHAGVVRMKAEARSHFWWPGLDGDIERLAKKCPACTMAAKETAKVHLQQWPVAENPWQRVHMDFACPFHSEMFLVIVDSFSKWPEVVKMRRTMSGDVIAVLEHLCGRYGYPKQLVTDNGPQFTSAEFADYCKANGIAHLRTAPGHPQSNGQAERYVGVVGRQQCQHRRRTAEIPIQVSYDTASHHRKFAR